MVLFVNCCCCCCWCCWLRFSCDITGSLLSFIVVIVGAGIVAADNDDDVEDDNGVDVIELVLLVVEDNEQELVLFKLIILKNWLAIRLLPTMLFTCWCCGWLDVNGLSWAVVVAMLDWRTSWVGFMLSMFELDVGDIERGDSGDFIGDNGKDVVEDGLDE